MTHQHTEGLVLQAFPYQEHHHIITVFTQQGGLIKLFVRGTHHTRRFSHAVVTPLTRAEFIYSSKNNGLYRLHDVAVLDTHSALRSEYDALQLACTLLQVILQTQLPAKPSPPLYQLLLMYLTRLPHTANAPAMLCSFLIKILKHEGILALRTHCSLCQEDLSVAYLARGDTLCRHHAHPEALSFDESELLILCQLNSGRTFEELEQLVILEPLQRKIRQLFDQWMLL